MEFVIYFQMHKSTNSRLELATYQYKMDSKYSNTDSVVFSFQESQHTEDTR